MNSIFANNTLDDLLSYLDEHRPSPNDPIRLDRRNAEYLGLDEDDFADMNANEDVYVTIDELMFATNDARETEIFSEGEIAFAGDIIRYRDELVSGRRGGSYSYARMFISSVNGFLKREPFSLSTPEWLLRLKRTVAFVEGDSDFSFSAGSLLGTVDAMLSQNFENEEIFALLDHILGMNRSAWLDNLLDVAKGLAERGEPVQNIISIVRDIDSLIRDNPSEDFFIISAFNEMLAKGSPQEVVALLKDVKAAFGRLNRSFLGAAEGLFVNGMARGEIITTLKQFRSTEHAVFYNLPEILKAKPLEEFKTLKGRFDHNLCFSAENGAYSSLAPLISAGWSDERIVSNYSAITDYFREHWGISWDCWRAYEALVPYARARIDEADALKFIEAYRERLGGQYERFPSDDRQSLFAAIRATGAPFEEAFDLIKWYKERNARSWRPGAYIQYFRKMKGYGFSYRKAIDIARAAAVNTPQQDYQYIQSLPDWLLLGFEAEDVIDIALKLSGVDLSDNALDEFLNAIYMTAYDSCIDTKKVHDLIVKILISVGDYKTAVSLFKSLWIPSVSEEASIKFMEDLAKTTGARDLSKVVDVWLSWGIGTDETLDILRSIGAQLVDRYRNQSRYSYEPLKDCYFYGLFRDFEKNRIGFGLFTRYGQEDLSTAYRTASLLNLDLSTVKDKASLADELVSRANRFFAGTNDLGELRSAAQMFATTINFMHDVEGELGEGDSIRERISSELSLEAVYYLLSLGGGSLYTSTFHKLFARLSKDNFETGFSRTIKQERTFPLFVMTLSRFARLSNAYDWSPEYFEKSISKMLSELDAQRLINNAGLITSAVKDILTSNAAPRLKDYLEGLLVERYNGYRKAKDADRSGAIGFLLKTNEGRLENKEAIKIVRGLPDIPRLSVPKEWFKDGKLTLGVYFYQEWFYRHFISFFSEKGFSAKRGNAHAVLKGGVEGLNVEIEVFFGPPSEGTSFKDFDMVFHRGHSHQSDSTFVNEMMPSDGRQRLYYDGGCGGLNRVLSRQQANPGDLFMGDLDMGQGTVNTMLTYQLIRSVALARGNKGLGSWTAVKKWIERKMKIPGIIFPDEEGLQVRNFIARVQSDLERSF